MKIIDYEIKGNQVKFYLGVDNLKDWWGDDWNDRPYEHNAGTVYNEYCIGYTIKTFDFEDVVMEPCDGEYNSPYSKEDMKDRKVPCICVLPKEHKADFTWYSAFKDILGNQHTINFYFGDTIDCDNIVLFEEAKFLNIVVSQELLDKKVFQQIMNALSSTIYQFINTNTHNNFDIVEQFKSHNLKKLQQYMIRFIEQQYLFFVPEATKESWKQLKETISIEWIPTYDAMYKKMNNPNHQCYLCVSNNYQYDIGYTRFNDN